MVKLYKGDCLEVMKTIPNKSIDAIITDPPYGTTQCKWDSVIDFDLMWEQLNRIIKPNGAIVLFGSEPFSSALRMSNIKNYKYDIVWQKDKPSNPLNAKRQVLKYHENISIFYKKQSTYNPQKTLRDVKNKRNNKPRQFKSQVNNDYNNQWDKTIQMNQGNSDYIYPKSVQKFNMQRGKHPTQKPIALMEYLIKTYTNENETVLDFTMGSGTTILACDNLNRNGIGIEMDEKYFNIAKKRVEDNKLKLF
jgi:site-specific DNA-methyltransferase (adenine-specific)